VANIQRPSLKPYICILSERTSLVRIKETGDEGARSNATFQLNHSFMPDIRIPFEGGEVIVFDDLPSHREIVIH